MSSDKSKLRKFKVFYFIGDYFSSKGEKRRYTIVLANSESEAEYIFKKQFFNCNFASVICATHTGSEANINNIFTFL